MLGLSCFTASSKSFRGEYSKESSVVKGPLAIIIRNSAWNWQYKYTPTGTYAPLSHGTLIWIWIPIGIQITIESADCISHSTVALAVNDVMVVVTDNWRKWLLLQWLPCLCSFGLLWLSYRRKQRFRRRKRRLVYQSLQHQSASSTGSRQKGLPTLIRHRRHSSALCPRFLYLFLSAFYFYSTLGYIVMIAAPVQLFNEFGKDAPYASLFSAYFSRMFGRLTTRLRNLDAESRYNPPSN